MEIQIKRIKLLGKPLFRQPIVRVVLYSLCCGLTIILIFLVGLIKHPMVVAAETPAAVVAQTSNVSNRCQFGIYVMRLNNFNFTQSEFFIDAWLNANCSTANAPEPNSLDFPTAKTYKMLNTETVKQGGKLYWNSNLEGKFEQNWNLTSYPFDRHRLEFYFEASGNTDATLAFEADIKHSGIHPDINLEDGWKITKFSVEPGISKYMTNFGDPRVKKNTINFSKVIFAFDIQRTSYISFAKLVAGVYIAFTISLLCVFFDVSQNDLFTGSLSILIGCLFAVFVNSQVAESVLGTVEGLTLVDEIHIATMLFILFVCVVQTIFHMLYKKEIKRNIKQIERFIFGVFVALYVLINTILIVSGYMGG